MEFYKSPNETSINTKTMTASYLWTYLIFCRIKILYDNLNKTVCMYGTKDLNPDTPSYLNISLIA